MISARSTLFPFAIAPLFLALLLAPRPAAAQVHWDGNIQAGVSGRIFSNNGLPGSIGPVIGLEGDVALIPLLRLGLYADYEYADTSEPAFPSVVSFGMRVKVMLPGYRNNVHWWLFTGIGGVAWEAPGYAYSDCTNQNPVAGQSCAGNVPAASGFFGEVPLGIGMGWRLRHPYEVVAELQGRFGFSMNGSYFTPGDQYSNPGDGSTVGPGRPAGNGVGGVATGDDVFAILFTLGIGLDN